MAYSNRANQDDLRRSLRYPTYFNAQLMHSDRLINVTVQDISAEGISVQGEHLPCAGTRVSIQANGLNAKGWMIWCDGHVGGLSFSQTVDPLAIVRANLAEFRHLRIPSSEAIRPVTNYHQ